MSRDSKKQSQDQVSTSKATKSASREATAKAKQESTATAPKLNVGEPQSNVSEPQATPPSKPETKAPRKVSNPLEHAEYFGKQYTKSADLPDPTERLRALAFGLVQVMSGERPIDQLATWVTDDVYQRLRIKTQGTLAAIRAGKVKANRLQNLQVGSMKTSSPRDGVVESVVLLRSLDRTRAVTIRLEGINNRWRATSLSLL